MARLFYHSQQQLDFSDPCPCIIVVSRNLVDQFTPALVSAQAPQISLHVVPLPCRELSEVYVSDFVVLVDERLNKGADRAGGEREIREVAGGQVTADGLEYSRIEIL